MFAAGAPTTIKQAIEPKLFCISVTPLVGLLVTDTAELQALIADVEAKGQSVGAQVVPILTTLDSVGSQKLDAAAFPQPCEKLVAELKVAATTLAGMAWPAS